MGDEQSGDRGSPSPDEAFAAVGHEVRVGILEALTATDRANRPLSFSALRDRVGGPNSARFNYHLDRLVGQFVERTDDGYDFLPAGKRVANAVLSGAVTDDVSLELVGIDRSCWFCGGRVHVTYRGGRVGAYCPDCDGLYGSSNRQARTDAIPDEYGFLGYFDLPPAGTTDRSPSALYDAAQARNLSDCLTAAGGVCPRCASPLDEWLTVCERHDGPGRCEDCGHRYGALRSSSCTNCTYDQRVPLGLALLADTDLQAFLTAHGVNLTVPDGERYARVLLDYDEVLLGTDPFEARVTFTAGDDAIALTVDGAGDVVDAT